MLGLGMLFFLIDVIHSLVFGEEAGDDPWKSDSLEWSISSPPPIFSFFTVPIVRSRHPLWDPAGLADPDLEKLQKSLTAQPSTWRGNLVTESSDARPQAIQYLPGPTYLPRGAAIATAIAAVGVLGRAYLVSAFGLIVLLIILLLWLYPQRRVLQLLRESTLPESTGLPVMSTGPRSTVWWGMICWLAIYASSFAALLYTHFYLRLFAEQWPPESIGKPGVWLAVVAYGALIVGSSVQCYGLTLFRREKWRAAKSSLVIALGCGGLYIAVECWEFWTVGFTPMTDAYGSIFFVLSWAVMLAVLVGIILSFTAMFRFRRAHVEERESLTLHLELASLQWGLAAGVGVLGFITLYLSPYFL
jgi:cytochrome c oxidase subunit I+III